MPSFFFSVAYVEAPESNAGRSEKAIRTALNKREDRNGNGPPLFKRSILLRY